MEVTVPSRAERVAEFYRRIKAEPAPATRLARREQLARLLKEVEDEMSGIPYDPEERGDDGRMYPPRDDSERDVPNAPGVTRYRTKGHNVFIGDNGAVEVQIVGTGEQQLALPGADGKGINT